MNNKDPFETFLKNQSFSEKAPESILLKLEKNASWNRPWWKSPASLVALIAAFVVALVVLFVAVSQPPTGQAPAQVTEEPQLLPEPEVLPQVIAMNGDKEVLSPFQRLRADSEPEFNLSFIDRPVNFINARREYADLI